MNDEHPMQVMPPMPYPHPYMQMPPQFQPMPLITMQEAILGYVNYKEAKGKDRKTIDDIALSLRTLSFVKPEIQYLHQLTKRVVLEYEGLIADLPANYRKSHRLRSLRFSELRYASVNLPKLSPASIDKYTLTLRAFINWCQSTDRMPTWKLPKFEGLDKRNSKDKRHPFTTDELKTLLTSPQFSGHGADINTRVRRHVPGTHLVKDCHYWVPLIGLYTGMRLGEIIQLWVSDVRREGEIVYLDVNQDDEGKSLKNEASRRKVPLHPELIALGLLDYIESARQTGHQRLFYDAPVTAAGSLVDIFSKRFSRYLTAIGVKHKRLSFHSLRHTFIDQAARQARLPDHLIKALVGHADHTITFGTYGGRLSVAELAEAMYKINFNLSPNNDLIPSPTHGCMPSRLGT